MACVGGFTASAMSDHWSRKLVMQIGVIATTFFTLLIPLVQTAEQLIIVRLLTGLGGGFAVSAAFPIAAELMPARHRRTYGAIYEMSLAASFTAVLLVSFLLAGNPNAFRLMALPGGLMLFVAPALIHFLIPESPRWHLRRGRAEAAVDIVNRIISRAGSRVPPFVGRGARDQHRDRPRSASALLGAVSPAASCAGPWSGSLAACAPALPVFMIHILLPKALVDQGAAVSLSFGLATIIYAASIPGKAFTGYLMEIIGRRWTIFYALAGSLPGLFLMLMAHRAGAHATIVMMAGGLITGFTVLSSFSATRVYLSEQFPTALRGRGHIFGELFGRIFAGVLAPFLMTPHTGSPTIFFGTILVVVAVGAFIPVLFGKETVGQLEAVTEAAPALA